MILAIDPGSFESAYTLIDDDLRPKEIGKIKNEEIFEKIQEALELYNAPIAIEMIQSYGMGVGQEVFDTCVWVGRFTQYAGEKNVTLIYRKEEKMNLCHNTQAKDGNIIQALVDRFAYGVRNKGKGTVKEKGWFFGFYKDIWQSYAVGITYFDLYYEKVVRK